MAPQHREAPRANFSSDEAVQQYVHDLLDWYASPPPDLPQGDPVARLERLIESVLQAGDRAEHEGFLNAASLCCTMVADLIAVRGHDSLARRLNDRVHIAARQSLLCANVMARQSESLTPALRDAFATAIKATHEYEPNGIMECLAHRAYGAVLLYYGQYHEAMIELAHPYHVLNIEDERTHYRWVTATAMLAEATYRANHSTIHVAIGLLRRATGRIDETPTIGPEQAREGHVAAAVLLATLLHNSNQDTEAKRLLEHAVAVANRIDPDHSNQACNDARQALRLGLTIFTAAKYLRHRRVMQI